jgi:hypothetical protein
LRLTHNVPPANNAPCSKIRRLRACHRRRTNTADYTQTHGILPLFAWRPPVAGAHPALRAWCLLAVQISFTENLGILPNFPWRPPVAGAYPALRAWRLLAVLISASCRCLLGDLRSLVLTRPSGPGACWRFPSRSRKISASCRIFLGDLRSLVRTRPSGPGACWRFSSRHPAVVCLATSGRWHSPGPPGLAQGGCS